MSNKQHNNNLIAGICTISSVVAGGAIGLWIARVMFKNEIAKYDHLVDEAIYNHAFLRKYGVLNASAAADGLSVIRTKHKGADDSFILQAAGAIVPNDISRV